MAQSVDLSTEAVWPPDESLVSEKPLAAVPALRNSQAAPRDGSRTVAKPQTALLSARMIGMAIGITMRDYRISQAAAHALLIRTSQNGNIKLRDVAAGIVADAESAPSPTRPTRRSSDPA